MPEFILLIIDKKCYGKIILGYYKEYFCCKTYQVQYQYLLTRSNLYVLHQHSVELYQLTVDTYTWMTSYMNLLTRSIIQNISAFQTTVQTVLATQHIQFNVNTY